MEYIIENFSVGYQNIHGLHDQLGCKAERLENELKHDIEILSEVWGCNCILTFENYKFDIIEPQKHVGVKKGRKSGGFIILTKNNIDKKMIKFIKRSNNFVWIEVYKKLIQNLDENLLIVASYINDITSTYYNDNIFEELNRDVLTFCNGNKPVLLMGDLNSRTGNLNEIYNEPDSKFLPNFPQDTKFVDLPKRRNCDEKEDTHGKKIITFCKSFNFIILNGRTKGDNSGNYTHLNFNNGPSAVDYGICNEKGYELIDNFLVLPLNEISDHSKIVTILKDIPPPRKKQEINDYMWKARGTLYVWDDKGKNNFFKSLNDCTLEMNEILQRIDAGLIHSTGEKIQQIFINTAKATLKIRNKKIGKNWKKEKSLKNGLTEIVQNLRLKYVKLKNKSIYLRMIIF